jgi:hypothetical protein
MSTPRRGPTPPAGARRPPGDLPRAERLSELLYDLAAKSSSDVDALEDDDYVEDYLFIERVEPGSIWFEGGIGPLKVPKAASDLAKPGWSVNVALARVKGAWQLARWATLSLTACLTPGTCRLGAGAWSAR